VAAEIYRNGERGTPYICKQKDQPEEVIVMKITRVKVSWIFFMIVLAGLFHISTGASLAGSAAPLPPEGFKILDPSQTIPPEIREFSGKWGGEMENTGSRTGRAGRTEWMNVLLVVEEIVNDKQAKVYLSWGDVQGPAAKAKQGGKRLLAIIDKENDEPILSCEVKKKDWNFTFKLRNGVLVGYMHCPTARLKRWGDLSRIP
jgi:hypothetical protein